MSGATQYPLARSVRRVLDVFRIIAIASLILWPLFVIVMIISQRSEPHSWGVDIGVFAHFNIDLKAFGQAAMEASGVRDPVISGKAMLNVDTSSLKALYLFTLLTEIGGIVGLYILLKIRALFAALENGLSFSQENSARIKQIGIATLTWALISPLLQYFGGRAILAEYALSAPGVHLSPAFSINGLALFMGIAMITLASVLDEATRLQELQTLTI